MAQQFTAYAQKLSSIPTLQKIDKFVELDMALLAKPIIRADGMTMSHKGEVRTRCSVVYHQFCFSLLF
jgi:hypothetical protein